MENKVLIIQNALSQLEYRIQSSSLCQDESQGDVTLGELFGYIEKQVARTSLTVIKKSQTPSVAAGAEAQAWEDRKL